MYEGVKPMKASKILICLLLALSLCLCLVLASCDDGGDGGDVTPPPSTEDTGDKKGQVHATGNAGGAANNTEPNESFDDDETLRS